MAKGIKATSSSIPSSAPTPADEEQLVLNGVSIELRRRVSADAKRYASLFKSHIENRNSYYKVKFEGGNKVISLYRSDNNTQPVVTFAYNAKAVKNAYLLLRMFDCHADNFVKDVNVKNKGVIPNLIGDTNDYTQPKTPEDDLR